MYVRSYVLLKVHRKTKNVACRRISRLDLFSSSDTFDKERDTQPNSLQTLTKLVLNGLCTFIYIRHCENARLFNTCYFNLIASNGSQRSRLSKMWKIVNLNFDRFNTVNMLWRDFDAIFI